MSFGKIKLDGNAAKAIDEYWEYKKYDSWQKANYFG
jgi:hypothetical protein